MAQLAKGRAFDKDGHGFGANNASGLSLGVLCKTARLRSNPLNLREIILAQGSVDRREENGVVPRVPAS